MMRIIEKLIDPNFAIPTFIVGFLASILALYTPKTINKLLTLYLKGHEKRKEEFEKKKKEYEAHIAQMANNPTLLIIQYMKVITSLLWFILIINIFVITYIYNMLILSSNERFSISPPTIMFYCVLGYFGGIASGAFRKRLTVFIHAWKLYLSQHASKQNKESFEK